MTSEMKFFHTRCHKPLERGTVSPKAAVRLGLRSQACETMCGIAPTLFQVPHAWDTSAEYDIPATGHYACFVLPLGGSCRYDCLQREQLEIFRVGGGGN